MKRFVNQARGGTNSVALEANFGARTYTHTQSVIDDDGGACMYFYAHRYVCMCICVGDFCFEQRSLHSTCELLYV